MLTKRERVSDGPGDHKDERIAQNIHRGGHTGGQNAIVEL